MRPRTLIISVAALLLAAGAIFLGAKIVGNTLKKNATKTAATVAQPAAAVTPAPEPMQRVVVLTVPKAVGDTIDSSTDLTIVEKPASLVPSDAITASDLAAEPAARNFIDGFQVLNAASPGDIVERHNFREAPKETTLDASIRQAVEADRAYLKSLTENPEVVIFDENQLADVRIRADIVADVWMESPVPGIDNMVGRELILSGITLRAVSLDVTGGGAKPVFYTQVAEAEAGKIRAAQSVVNGHVKVEPHRDRKSIPPVGQICTGPNLCFEQKPAEYDPLAYDPEKTEANKLAPAIPGAPSKNDTGSETRKISVKPAEAPAD